MSFLFYGLLCQFNQLPSNSLPDLPLKIVGREVELRNISGWIDFSNPHTDRIISIFGPPGFGKSTLAIQIGHIMVCEGVTVHYVDMIDVLSMQSLAEKVLDSADSISEIRNITIDSLYKWAKQQHHRILLIFDNCDDTIHREKDEFQKVMRKLIHSGQNFRIIMTSRRKIIQHDQKAYHIQELSTSASCSLLQNTAGASINTTACESITNLTGSVPLALRVVGAILKLPDPPDLSTILADLKEELILTLSSDNLSEEECVNASISLSYRYLSLQMQKIGRYLAHFRGSFDQEAACRIILNINIESDPLECSDAILDNLSMRSLLECSKKLKRCQFHQLIRHFFLHVVKVSGDAGKNETVKFTSSFQFHYAYFLQSLVFQFSNGSDSTLTRLDQERHNIRHLLDCTAESTQRLTNISVHVYALSVIQDSLDVKFLNCRFTAEELLLPVKNFVDHMGIVEHQVEEELLFPIRTAVNEIKKEAILLPDIVDQLEEKILLPVRNIANRFTIHNVDRKKEVDLTWKVSLNNWSPTPNSIQQLCESMLAVVIEAVDYTRYMLGVQCMSLAMASPSMQLDKATALNLLASLLLSDLDDNNLKPKDTIASTALDLLTSTQTTDLQEFEHRNTQPNETLISSVEQTLELFTSKEMLIPHSQQDVDNLIITLYSTGTKDKVNLEKVYNYFKDTPVSRLHQHLFILCSLTYDYIKYDEAEKVITLIERLIEAWNQRSTTPDEITLRIANEFSWYLCEAKQYGMATDIVNLYDSFEAAPVQEQHQHVGILRILIFNHLQHDTTKAIIPLVKSLIKIWKRIGATPTEFTLRNATEVTQYLYKMEHYQMVAELAELVMELFTHSGQDQLNIELQLLAGWAKFRSWHFTEALNYMEHGISLIYKQNDTDDYDDQLWKVCCLLLPFRCRVECLSTLIRSAGKAIFGLAIVPQSSHSEEVVVTAGEEWEISSILYPVFSFLLSSNASATTTVVLSTAGQWIILFTGVRFVINVAWVWLKIIVVFYFVYLIYHAFNILITLVSMCVSFLYTVYVF